MKVILTYFRTSGKYYSQGEYEADEGLPLYMVWDDVKKLLDSRTLPGLVPNHSDYIVSVDVREHPHNHPHLVMPGQPDFPYQRIEEQPTE